MQTLTRNDLFSLEKYAEIRPEFRAGVIEHKKHRRVQLGPHLTLCFEDRTSMHYQVQEMLRIERIFEAAAIQEELDAYNPLIPDGSNWKATMLIEYPDIDERRSALAALTGIENQVWVRVGDHETVTPVADEDLERSTDDKTSAVHFLRFELTADMIRDLKDGAALAMGVDHPEYTQRIDPIPEPTRVSLINDLD